MTMPAEARNLGRKFTCFKCSCKFYDMERAEPLCPRCGADQREDPNPDPREALLARFRRPSSGKSSEKKKKSAAAPAPPTEEDVLPPMDAEAEEPGAEPAEDGELLDEDLEMEIPEEEPGEAPQMEEEEEPAEEE